MKTEWGYPHALAIVATLLFLGSWLTDRRAERRRRKDASEEAYCERFHRRLGLGQRESADASQDTGTDA